MATEKALNEIRKALIGTGDHDKEIMRKSADALEKILTHTEEYNTQLRNSLKELQLLLGESGNDHAKIVAALEKKISAAYKLNQEQGLGLDRARKITNTFKNGK